MSDTGNRVEQDRQLINEARGQSSGATLWAYTKLSGPGWLQSAITLGGGSLGGSLYLGVIGGYEMMWLQPLMLILGIVMLSAISYVTLSTGDRPFRAINEHINPVLGWGWVIATLMANLVWAMPQFGLGTAALQQNLFPSLLGSDDSSKWICVGGLFLASAVTIYFYDRGGWGVRLFEILLKVMVAVVVFSFIGVVLAMSFRGSGLPWGTILAGFVPDVGLLFEPADRFRTAIAESSAPEYWTGVVLGTQRDTMVTAAATAVGINMTFLLPYTMLKRGWDRDFRGLAVFDLSTGLFLPFVLATSCVVIASATQFHTQYDPGLLGEGERTGVTEKLNGGYIGNLNKRVRADNASGGELSAAELERRREALPAADRKLAAMLVKRDAFVLANSLEELTGREVAHYVFGAGVLGMAISSIIILMLINGFTICEMLGRPSEGPLHLFGAMLPGLSGGLGFLFLWGGKEADFWIVTPTSVFGMTLLPIAYLTFLLLVNNRQMLGEYVPRGPKRVAVNIAMLLALTAAMIGAGWSIWSKARWIGVGIVAVLVGLALLVHKSRRDGTHPAISDTAARQPSTD